MEVKRLDRLLMPLENTKGPGHVDYLVDLLGMEGPTHTTNLIRDIRYLARQWDSTVERLDWCTFRLLLMIGTTLLDTYLRGHGVRYVYRKDEPPVAQASLLALVIKEAANSNDRHFPNLRSMGVTNIESFGDRASRSLRQRGTDG
jgi:hypothetical protein